MPEGFVCPVCGASFGAESELKAHGASHMSSGSGSGHASFECKACGTHFPSETELKAHGAKAHPM